MMIAGGARSEESEERGSSHSSAPWDLEPSLHLPDQLKLFLTPGVPNTENYMPRPRAVTHLFPRLRALNHSKRPARNERLDTFYGPGQIQSGLTSNVQNAKRIHWRHLSQPRATERYSHFCLLTPGSSPLAPQLLRACWGGPHDASNSSRPHLGRCGSRRGNSCAARQ